MEIKRWFINQVKASQRELEGLRISLLGLCPLRHFLAVKQGEKFTDETLLIFYRGWVLEEMIREYFKYNFPHRVRYQYKISHPWGIGHADIVFPAEKLIYEIKSCDDTASLPQDRHVFQLNTYLHFQRQNTKQEWNGRLIYVKTPSLDIEEFIVNYNPELGKKAEQELEFLSKCLLDNTPPFEKARWHSWECTYTTRRKNTYTCPHYDFCKSHFEKEETTGTVVQAVQKENLEEFVKLEEKIKILRKELNDLEANREEMIENLFVDTIAVEDEKYIITLNQYPIKRLDTERLKLEKPEVYNEYVKETFGKRIKITKKEVQK